MEKIEYQESFKDLVSKRVANYLGIGNPNSKILFVGKEGSMENICSKEISTSEKWAEAIKEKRPYFEKYTDEFRGGHTWKKYQKLHDYIFPDNITPKEINFGERIFATEMSEIRKKTTKEAQREFEFIDRLKNRKNTFFKSDFIQQFPVILLACGDYIKNNDEVREIDDIFKVEFEKKYPDENEKHRYSFYTHYNKDKSKLVIHTRQLSGDVPDELLKKMGEIIRNFIK